uniref:Uncharacterized protein n=1 Tax=Grammatophora oceanica TaxID=210454 RepID=A0A7S1Y3K7_9STRA|mmetsp:Transcript_16525/g.24438  ORF Transcript_16525/g.24438 Transcript_16525/m.24438 type:complete len:193 (+) Transcript_16525:198-776(+)
MDNTIHALAMLIIQFGLLAALLFAVDTDNDGTQAKARPLLQDAGWNMKGYLLLIAFFYVLLWMFINSDGQVSTDVIHDEADFETPLAWLNWNSWSVGGCLENALVLVWTARYGKLQHQAAVCWSMAALQVVAVYIVYVLKPITTNSIYVMTTGSFIVMMHLAIMAAFKYHNNNNNNRKAQSPHAWTSSRTVR